jgi:hypothetical protein
MQIARSFDAETLGKIKRGLLISLSGAVIAGSTVFGMDIKTWLETPASGLIIHWNLIALASFGAFSTSIANTVKEYFSGTLLSEIEDPTVQQQ